MLMHIVCMIVVDRSLLTIVLIKSYSDRVSGLEHFVEKLKWGDGLYAVIKLGSTIIT